MSNKNTVLVIVEDDPDMRLLIRAHLEREPRIEVVGEAADAATAIELARAAQPALIVLDHSIEGDVMGLEAAPMLKQAAPNVKILLFTAYDMGADAAREPAVDVFLPKSRIGELLPTVCTMLALD